MNLAKFSVNNSLFVNFLSFLLLILGIAAAFIIRKEAFPNIRSDYVQVQTAYPGALSEDVERYVTIPIEKEILGVSGVEEVTSDSRENLSYIAVKINPDVEKKKVVDDIQKAVDRVKKDLPPELEDDPEADDIDFNEHPVIEYCLAGLPEEELQYYAEVLETRLEDVEGVARIDRRGWRDTEVWVEADPGKMGDAYVSYEEIVEALKKRNISMPSGKFYAGDKEIHVRTTGEFKTPEEIEDVIIRANDAGNWLRIRDVANVRYGFEDEDIINKTFGQRSVNLVVIKKELDDTIEVVRRTREIIRDFSKEVPQSLIVTEADDVSYYVKRRLDVLKRNAIMGAMLVISSLLIFLNRRVALFTALGMGIAFTFSIFIMASLDISINLISMFGLIVVLGMLVDDGIIVGENCYRYIEEGYHPREAAVIGTNEVTKPVLAAVITTMVASAALFVMGGMMGRYLRAIPMVIIIALSVSLFEVLVILPSHIADFVKAPKKDKTGKLTTKKDTVWFKKLLNFYSVLLEGAIKNRYKVLLGLIGVFVICIIVMKVFMGFEFFSSRGVELFFVRIEAEPGTPLYETEKLAKPVEEIIEQLPENELDNYVTQVGMVGDDRSVATYMNLGSHLAQITVYLTPPDDRDREAGDIIKALREKGRHITNAKVTFEEVRPGPPGGKAVEYKIMGEKYEVLREIAEKYKDFLGSIKGVVDIEDDYKSGKEEIMVAVDRDKATEAGLTTSDIGATLRSVFKGTIATTIKPEKAEEEIDVLVRLRADERDAKKVFDKIMVPNKFGKLIPLKNVAHFKEKDSMFFIRHIDGKKSIRVSADVDKNITNSNEVNKKILKHFKNIESEYLGYKVSYGGEYEEQVKAVRNLAVSFLLALLFVFMILAAIFNSIVQPLIIMMAIPFGFIGVIVAFFVHRMPFSFMSFLGFVFLTGVVVNDSIVLVEFINKLRKSGIDRRHSIMQAGQIRLRPVILTTVTTVFGLLPVAYAIGGGDPILIPMALAICWGLLFSTALTLIVIPCIYAILDDFTIKLFHHPTVK